jgi:amidase
MAELWQLNASRIHSLVTSGEVSATDVAESLLGRIESVNPRINAIVQEMPDEALRSAKATDDRIAGGEDAGALAGVPVTIKVNVDQAGFATTNGLRMLAENIAREDNPVVRNLKDAGAIIVGRTNTPAFSMRWFTRNSIHGATTNPRNPDLTPGGSSGGAAAAVATGMGAIGHGTDIAGSIRYPAYACGVHGLRPTFGRVPAWNPSLPDRYIGGQITAVSGPIARSVVDLRLGLAAMSDASELDPWWVPVSAREQDVPKRAVLCLSPGGIEISGEIAGYLHGAAERLQNAGWEVTETECPPLRKAMDCQLLLWMSEFFIDGGASIAKEGDPDASFVYEQLCELAPEVTAKSLLEALQYRAGLVREWTVFMNRHTVMLCPVSAEPPFPDSLDVESADSFRRVIEAQLPQIALPFTGLPAMTLTTETGRIPGGVQLVAAPFREDVLLQAAEDIESRCEMIDISNGPAG